MQIDFVEIQNFRKLKSIHVDLAKKTTLFVGANNSGKTSTMIALSRFLADQGRFTTNDFTLSNWTRIDRIGTTWEAHAGEATSSEPTLDEWESVLPSMR
jgi:predicted ATP-dependent endonuclease of OLD family